MTASAEGHTSDTGEKGAHTADSAAVMERSKIDKREFIRGMADAADLPLAVAERAYEAFITTMFDQVRAGNQVNLTGFGKFYWQRHRGHRAHFSDTRVPDYTVLKFSGTRNTNEFLGLDDERANAVRVPGTRRGRGSRGGSGAGTSAQAERTDSD